MATLKVSLNGFKELKERLSKSNLQKEVNAELEKGAERMRAGAINDAPFGAGGLLRGGIGVEGSGNGFRVFSNASYSGYVEFGTKKKVSVPAGLESVAAELRGKGGGTAEQALKSIMEWVRLKGIRIESAATFKSGKKQGHNKQLTVEQTAYIIFHFIMLNGIKPHPFFFKQLDKFRPEIIKNVENVLKNA